MIEKKSVSLAAKTLTNAEIKALQTTGIELIPAPGAGRIIVPIDVLLHLKSTVAYTNFDPQCSLYVARGSSGSKLFHHTSPDLLLGQAASYTSKMAEALNLLDAILTDADTDVTNKALNLKMENGILGDLLTGAAGNILTVCVLFYTANIQL